MEYQLLKHPCHGLGSCVSVWINSKKNLIKRKFNTDLPLISGQLTNLSQEQIQERYHNEVRWLHHLQGTDYVPKLYDVDDTQLEIVQEYLGPDLLILKETDKPLFLEARECWEQVEEIYKDLVGVKRVLKLNSSLSNMAISNGSIKIFDFKWAQTLDNRLQPSLQSAAAGCLTVEDDELYSYDNYMVKLHPDLSTKLRAVLNQSLEKRGE